MVQVYHSISGGDWDRFISTNKLLDKVNSCSVYDKFFSRRKDIEVSDLDIIANYIIENTTKLTITRKEITDNLQSMLQGYFDFI